MADAEKDEVKALLAFFDVKEDDENIVKTLRKSHASKISQAAKSENPEEARNQLDARLASVLALIEPTEPKFLQEANEILPRLYIGPFKVAEQWEKLNEMGITHIISVAAEGPPQYPDNFTYLHYNFQESTCTAKDVCDVCLDCFWFITNALDGDDSKSNRVLIHCNQGKTRSAMIMVYYVAQVSGKSIKDAYDFVRSKRDVLIPEDWLYQLALVYANMF